MQHTESEQNDLSLLSLSPAEVKIGIWVLLFSLLAKGAVLFSLAYSIDDYGGMLSYSHKSVSLYLKNGRFGMVLLYKILNYLGASPPVTNIAYSFLYIICLIWMALIICRIWRIGNNSFLAFMVVMCIVMHPYQAELLTFRSTAVYTSVSLFIAFAGLYLSKRKIKSMVYSSLAVAIALSIYQTFLNYFIITLSIALLIEILLQYKKNSQIDWPRIFHDTRFQPRLVTITSGTLLYLVINKLLMRFMTIEPSNRAQFLEVEKIPQRIVQLKDIMIRTLIKNEGLYPASLKIILLFLGLTSVLSLLIRVLLKGVGKSKLMDSIAIFLLLFTSVIAVAGIVIPLKSWWPMPRVLSGISIFWGGMIAFSYLSTDNLRLKQGVGFLSCLVLVGFVGLNNHILTDQLRVNMRDLHKASRIIDRMESHPGFPQVRRVAMIGGRFNYPSSIDTVRGDMNVPAFPVPWANVSILNELSGYKFTKATEEDQATAEEICQEMPKWPAPESVIIKGQLAVICQ